MNHLHYFWRNLFARLIYCLRTKYSLKVLTSSPVSWNVTYMTLVRWVQISNSSKSGLAKKGLKTLKLIQIWIKSALKTLKCPLLYYYNNLRSSVICCLFSVYIYIYIIYIYILYIYIIYIYIMCMYWYPLSSSSFSVSSVTVSVSFVCDFCNFIGNFSNFMVNQITSWILNYFFLK